MTDGKLTVVGGGWSRTGPDPLPFGIAILVLVPWDQANRKHVMRLELVDSDGNPVMMEAEDGAEAPVVYFDDLEFEVGRPCRREAGMLLDLPLAINSAPLPLEPGRYELAALHRRRVRRRLAPRLQRSRRTRRDVALAPPTGGPSRPAEPGLRAASRPCAHPALRVCADALSPPAGHTQERVGGARWRGATDHGSPGRRSRPPQVPGFRRSDGSPSGILTQRDKVRSGDGSCSSGDIEGAGNGSQGRA